MMRKILTAGLSDRHHHHITKPEVGNPRHNNKSGVLFLVIATINSLLCKLNAYNNTRSHRCSR